LRSRSAITALLLAMLVLSSVVAGRHSHDPRFASPEHSRSEVGPSQRDHRTVLAPATPSAESAYCVACLLRHRPRAILSLHPTPEGLKPDGSVASDDSEHCQSDGVCRLPGSRAPPLA
jgi:hypothetical protein